MFADGLLIPTGVAPGDNGVYVANSTELIHLQDTNGDGKITAPPWNQITARGESLLYAGDTTVGPGAGGAGLDSAITGANLTFGAGGAGGSYTAQVEGAETAAGNALVELYDAGGGEAMAWGLRRPVLAPDSK